jgi:hypothetical protein
MISVDLRSRISGGGRSAPCLTRGVCPRAEFVSSVSCFAETKIPTDAVVVLDSLIWETGASGASLQPQLSCEFDSLAGDESGLPSWQGCSLIAVGPVPANSKQARAQSGTCSTKSAVTVAISQVRRFTLLSMFLLVCSFTIGQPSRRVDTLPGYL